MTNERAPTAAENLPSWMRYSRFVGLDVHKTYITVVAINHEQAIVLKVRKVATTEWTEWAEWAEQHLVPTDSVVLESTTNA